MKIMVIIKADKDSEAGKMPDNKLLTEMGKFNEQLVDAGIMLSGDGLHPSTEGKRIMFKGNQRTVINGPFPEAKELIAGYWIWKVDSMDVAVEWAKRCPNPTGVESEIELRPIFEQEEFGNALTPELREQEDKLRAKIEKNISEQKITTFLTFDSQAEEAAKFYVSIFKNSKIVSVSYYDKVSSEVSGKAAGDVMTVEFDIEGQKFITLNAGPEFKFSPAISLFVSCKTQEEIDNLWAKLSEGGKVIECGWLEDKYGVSWQIVPSVLDEMLHDKDSGKSQRVMKAMLQMKKLDIRILRQAYEK